MTRKRASEKNPTYKAYVILERMRADKVRCYLAMFLSKFSRALTEIA